MQSRLIHKGEAAQTGSQDVHLHPQPAEYLADKSEYFPVLLRQYFCEISTEPAAVVPIHHQHREMLPEIQPAVHQHPPPDLDHHRGGVRSLFRLRVSALHAVHNTLYQLLNQQGVQVQQRR